MAEGTVEINYISAGLFVLQLQTAAGMTDNRVSAPAFKSPCRLLNAEIVMTGAGAATDTAKVQRESGGSRTDVSDAVDVAAFADKQVGPFGTIDDAEVDFGNGDAVEVLTVSDALVRVTMLFAQKQVTP